jgi:hypothetical protein
LPLNFPAIVGQPLTQASPATGMITPQSDRNLNAAGQMRGQFLLYLIFY